MKQIQNHSSSRLDLVFHPKIDSQKNYVMKVDKQFLDQLQSTQQFVVQGNANSEIIINSIDNSYKLKGINISTSMLVINQKGTICLQTSSYLDVQKFSPHFHQIYQTIVQFSCRMPDPALINHFQHFFDTYGFTQAGIRKQCYLSEQDFNRLSKAMNLLKITTLSQIDQDPNYIYISLHFSIWIIREMIKIFNQESKNLFQPISISTILERIPFINSDVIRWMKENYGLIIIENEMGQGIKFSPQSIMKFIIGEMALGKKQYGVFGFNQVLDQMLMIYMPAQYQTSSIILNNIKERQMDPIKQELYKCRYDYFIELREQKYIYYDYMRIETEIGSRLKYLSSFKNRWKINELRALFRGVDSTENGKYFALADVLLKKFRKYGEEYEIKFILPNK